MPRLPVSGREVALRPPDGTDDLLILETQGNAVSAGLALLARVAQPADADAADWAALTVTDFEFVLAELRVVVLGQTVLCAFDCPSVGCGERAEVSFRMADYVAAARPGWPRGVIAMERPEWFRFDDAAGSFRLPTAADQCAVLGRAGAARMLAERCLDPPDMPTVVRARAERAMAVMAPEISRPVAGRCPACGAGVRAGLHLPSLVMAEFRRAAAGLHEDVHLLASAYHWDERAILSLPRARRQGYAGRARQLLAGAA
ncbi:MAG: hypothetical protein ABI369_06575 [Acetobacteraceae bacterium]